MKEESGDGRRDCCDHRYWDKILVGCDLLPVVVVDNYAQVVKFGEMCLDE